MHAAVEERLKSSHVALEPEEDDDDIITDDEDFGDAPLTKGSYPPISSDSFVRPIDEYGENHRGKMQKKGASGKVFEGFLRVLMILRIVTIRGGLCEEDLEARSNKMF